MVQDKDIVNIECLYKVAFIFYLLPKLMTLSVYLRSLTILRLFSCKC